jgi:hypothetical protein
VLLPRGTALNSGAKSPELRSELGRTGRLNDSLVEGRDKASPLSEDAKGNFRPREEARRHPVNLSIWRVVAYWLRFPRHL